ncbi:hypothetical protein BGZ60DRAFT_70 [Tricladium varicosporioides]|nr:hypothetical protein BGZ60DRAFT_70 [Hymenoscyphus varicosporioides]
MKARNPDLHDYLPSTYRNGVYREDLEQANGGPSSSSQPGGPVNGYIDNPPPYEDTPLIPKPLSEETPKLRPQLLRFWYQHPPDLPFSNHDTNCDDVQTCFPGYSDDAETLRQMIYEQASYPPTYYLELQGTHTETTYRQGNRRGHNSFSNGRRRASGGSYESDTVTQNTVTDFNIRVNITHLLSQGPDIGGELELLPDNTRGYRGGIIKRQTPTIGSDEIQNQHDELKAWCDKYVADASKLKCFKLERYTTNHDTVKLEYLLRSLVLSTGYRGSISIRFSTQHSSVTVYNPSIINKWRMTRWICWVFYLSFLWILSWPFLTLATARYEVVKVVFPYADIPPEEEVRGAHRTPTVMSETAWFYLWERALRRGVLERMDCKLYDMDDAYRIATEEQASRAFHQGGVVGLYGVGSQFVGPQQAREGWGGDC